MAGRRAPGLKRANIDDNYTAEQLAELLKCAKDPIYFIKTYVKIKHPKRGKIPFNLYDYQEDLIHRYQGNRFNIIMSARQTGKTETSCAYLLWRAIFHMDETILIASNKSSNAMEIIAKIQYSYEELPSWLKPGIDESNWNKHTCAFDNKTRIVASTTSKDSGRGLAISLVYVDEFAFVPAHVQEQFWDAITPTISTGGSMIITSTPNGDSNLFARMWLSSNSRIPEERTEDDFIPLHVKWNQPPGRDEKFKAGMISKLGERKWQQEFECMLISSEHTLFDSYSITQAEQALTRRIENMLRFDSNKDSPHYTPSYPYRVAGHKFWKKLEKDKTYIVGVDPATGTGADFTVFEVFEFPSMIHVMEFRTSSMSSAVAYTQLKNLLKFLEQFTQDVYFSIENNGVGNGMISLYEADEDAPKSAHFVSEAGQKRLGMFTSPQSKIKSALKFKELFERGQMTLNSEVLFQEMKNYVRKDSAYAANVGAHDDTISAVLIVFRILQEMATYDDIAYMKMNTVETEIEVAGKWNYSDSERDLMTERREEYDENEAPMPFLL